MARAVWSLPDVRSAPSAVAAPPRGSAPRVGTGIVVDRLEPAAARSHREAWLDLAGRALEDNVFLDPDFALLAAQHLDAGRRATFLFAWASEARAPEDLVAVCAVTVRKGLFRALPALWLHDLSTTGIPLLDRTRAASGLRALLLWSGQTIAGAQGLVIRSLPADGPSAAVLRAVAAEAGLAVTVLDSWERAVLPRDQARAGLAALSAKGAKELRRQRRRLAERGVLAYRVARDGDALLEGVERFLTLEAAGWKGAAGTAFLARPDRTAFVRTMTRLLARRGLCRVDALSIDGVPVAMALLLRAGKTDVLWKIAYREDLARLSPGVQLMLHITDTQAGAGDDLAVTDSCAVPDHPMIDRLWRDRMRLVDVAVALHPGAAVSFSVAVTMERAARGLRAAAKQALQAWRAVRDGSAP